MIKKEFEEFLKKLKEAGAELFFVCKKMPVGHESKWKNSNNKDYRREQKLTSAVEEIADFRTLKRMFADERFNFEKSMYSALYYSAVNFGTFRGCDMFLKKGGSGNAEFANEINAYAIVGVDSSFLFYEGSYKVWFPTPNRDFHNNSNDYLLMKQFDKEAIFDGLELNSEKFILFAVLFQKFYSTDSNRNMLSAFFEGPNKFRNVKSFVLERVEFPLTRESIESIVRIIFSEVDPQVVQDFESSLASFKTTTIESDDRFHDGDINHMIRDRPFVLAERILNKQPLYVNSSSFNVNATDMKPLKDLFEPWYRRTLGMLLYHVDGIKTRKMIYRVTEQNFDELDVEAENPDCKFNH